MGPKPTFVIYIHGTWDIGKDAWWREGSEFCELAAENRIICKSEIERFHWCGLIDGIDIMSVLTLGLKADQHEVWDATGFAIRTYLQQFELHERNLIVHSHGLQCLAYARVPVNNIISVGSPIRNDMFPMYDILKKNSKSWHHIYDQKWDRFAFLGQIGDGKWFGSRECPFAENIKLRGIRHTKILKDSDKMKLWVENGWFDLLRK